MVQQWSRVSAARTRPGRLPATFEVTESVLYEQREGDPADNIVVLVRLHPTFEVWCFKVAIIRRPHARRAEGLYALAQAAAKDYSMHCCGIQNGTAAHSGTFMVPLRELVLIDEEPRNCPSCWRNVDDDGAATCTGAATVLELMFGIPVMFILEIPNAWTAGNRPQQWNFPVKFWCKIYAWYRIRHCWPGFYNGRHFTATFTPDGKNVFQYDGMQNEGFKRFTNLGPWRTAAITKIAAAQNSEKLDSEGKDQARENKDFSMGFELMHQLSTTGTSILLNGP
ncbi:hypothetical protein B0H13DRAFT_1861641 [Mycena leptocephala]|nr:hypothetical protein B0H13DRAFT_1861641 [Mycena leptocephala]